jgi:hypothetical protein
MQNVGARPLYIYSHPTESQPQHLQAIPSGSLPRGIAASAGRRGKFRPSRAVCNGLFRGQVQRSADELLSSQLHFLLAWEDTDSGGYELQQAELV